MLLHLFTGGGAQGFPCHVLVKSPELANYSLESLLGGGGQWSQAFPFCFQKEFWGSISVILLRSFIVVCLL